MTEGQRDAAARVMATLGAASDAEIATDVLQPADIFVELAGEEFRKRLFTTEGANGERLCLRPDFTIPVCLEHLARGGTAPAVYSYRGKIFRKRRRHGAPEFEQAGSEWLGHDNTVDTDASLFALALRCASDVGLSLDERAPQVRVGDAKVFLSLCAALGLSSAWTARLGAAYGDPVRMDAALARLASPDAGNGIAGRLAPALAKMEEAQARAIVEAVVGGGQVVGRSAADIADRILSEAASQVDPRAAVTISAYLDLAAPLERAADVLADFAARETVDLCAALEPFAQRTEALKAHGIDTSVMTFSAGFGRRLGYYTGFVFEVTDPCAPGAEVIAGGRYDGLVALLDRARSLPAIGFSVWLDRIPGAAP